jgi:hypothetical protein
MDSADIKSLRAVRLKDAGRALSCHGQLDLTVESPIPSGSWRCEPTPVMANRVTWRRT